NHALIQRGQVDDAQVRCAIRLMEARLGAVCPWSVDKDDKNISAAIAAFEDGQKVLQEYVGWRDRKYHNYACFLNTHRARAAYLDGEFSQAYQFLDAARAAIRRPDRGSEFSALAIVDLHHAECLVHHADAILKNPKGTHDASPRAAKEKLKRAQTS